MEDDNTSHPSCCAKGGHLRTLFDKVQSRFWRWTHPNARIGLALGVFDFCHEGHINLLRNAAASCDRLIVAVHRDETVQQYKGVRPLNSALERQARLQDLGLADVVEIGSDRVRLCRKHGADVVFHGDDWDRDEYIKHFGPELIADLGVEIELLKHTPGIDSTMMRAAAPRVGWWLYSQNPDWDRSHLHDHLSGLFDQVGGVWITGTRGREAVKRNDSEAPCAWIPDNTEMNDVCHHVASLDLDVIVTAHFNHDTIVEALIERGHACDLIVLSHGRSGKAGTSHDARLGRGLKSKKNGHDVVCNGCVTTHDWSYAEDSYGHLDGFLAEGGSFANPAPTNTKPRLLVLPTWGPDADKRGLLMSHRWRGALRALARTWDVVVSPHPLTEPHDLRKLCQAPGISKLKATGRSFAEIPNFDAVLSDMSGVLWEALLFDTPVMLASGLEEPAWSPDLAPTPDELSRCIPFVSPEALGPVADMLHGSRCPEQKVLAEQRLGPIDGAATSRMGQRIKDLLLTNTTTTDAVMDLPQSS
jgi:glycerol-3-phosphate cytidylyltransferase